MIQFFELAYKEPGACARHTSFGVQIKWPGSIRQFSRSPQRPIDQRTTNAPTIKRVPRFSPLSITATGAVTTVFKQIGKPVAEGYTAILILSIVVFVFSAAGLGHVLCGPHRGLARIPQNQLCLHLTARLGKHIIRHSSNQTGTIANPKLPICST